MASCNLSYSGNTSVINAKAYLTEVTTTGTTRKVRLKLTVYAVDYSGARDGCYSVYCAQSGTNKSIGMYEGSGWSISGSERTIFDETFEVSVPSGSSSATINFTFSAKLYSPTLAAYRSISGSITKLYLSEASVEASTISLSVSSVQMGKNLLISLIRDNSSCKHTLSYTFGGSTKTIAEDVTSSYAWAVPDLASLCNNALLGECTITCKTYVNGSSVGTSTAKVTLTVPDATTPSIENSEVTLGESADINCTRNSTNFTVKLEFLFYDQSFNIAEGKVDTKSWTPVYDLAKYVPTLTYATGTLKCTTMNGTAVVGTKSSTICVLIPDNEITRPVFTLDGLKLSPVSKLPDAFAGLYLRGMTGMKAEFTAKSTYSSIKSYSVTVGTQTASGNPATIDLLVSEGDVKVTAKVIDARGYYATITTTISILPYRSPKVTPYTGYDSVVCERALETGALDLNGTYLAIKAGKTCTSVAPDGVELNACTLRYRWKPANAYSYGEWITLLSESDSKSEVSVLVGNIVVSTQKSYSIEVSAADVLGGEHTLTFQIMTAAVSFVLYDGVDGAAFGKYPEEPHVVDIAAHMTLRVRGKLEVSGDTWVSLGLATNVSESVFERGRKETGCHYLVTEGSHVHVAFNCAFTYAGTAVIINRVAIKEKYRPVRTVHSICPVNDMGFALVSIDPGGYIRAEWVKREIIDADAVGTDVSWIDGYLDYWK